MPCSFPSLLIYLHKLHLFFPSILDAEGNGDSISAAVQAERIALLTNVLSRTRLDVNGNYQVPIHPSAAHSPSFTQQLEQINPSKTVVSAQRSHSLTPPAERTGLAPALLEISPPAHATINLLHPNGAVQSAPGPLNRPVQRSQSHYALGQQYQRQERYQAQMHRHLAPSPIYQTPLPPAGPTGFSPELHQPPSLPHFQQHHIHRNPSPLPVPLLYSTGPPSSPFLGAGLGMAGHRLRVLSSPATATPMDWKVINPGAADSLSSTSGSTPGSGSISSLGSLDIPQLTIGDNTVIVDGDRSASGSEMPTPAINTPLLPAFLRDVVSSPSGTKHGSEEILGTKGDMQSPRSLEGREVSPEEVVARVNSRLGRKNLAVFPLTTLTPVTNLPPHIVPRARNDSGSSTSSNSSLMSSSSSNISTSRVSLSMSATSLSSAGCGGSNGSVVGSGSIRIRPAAGSVGPHSSSSSPTISTATSCSTPPADSGHPTITAASASSLPFISFGGGGIWRMDGEESKGWNVPPAQPHRHVAVSVAGGQRGLNYGHGRHGGHELQGPLPLPVGAERRM